MTALENFFSNDQSDDLRSQGQGYNSVDVDNDGIGENSEQTPLAKAFNTDQGNQTTNAFPGPDDEIDEDDDDSLMIDDDLLEDDEELPLDDDELSDDDDAIGVDLDDDENDEDFDDKDTSINQSTSFDADFRPSNHGRTTGTLIDHEPGGIAGV